MKDKSSDIGTLSETGTKRKASISWNGANDLFNKRSKNDDDASDAESEASIPLAGSATVPNMVLMTLKARSRVKKTPRSLTIGGVRFVDQVPRLEGQA